MTEPIYTIDLNADLGEGFGAYEMGRDSELIPLVTSVNIAAGFHAGDMSTIRRTVQQAAQAGVAVGVHPGYPDLQGFGRRAMTLSAEEAYELVLYQMGAVFAFTRAQGIGLSHVKPHGALYHAANQDPRMGAAVARAIRAFDPSLALVAPDRGHLAASAREAGLRVVEEMFADRGYTPEGTLVPRGQPGSSLHDAEEAALRVFNVLSGRPLAASDGSLVHIRAQTVCVHGDSPDAVAFTRQLIDRLQQLGVQLKRWNS